MSFLDKALLLSLHQNLLHKQVKPLQKISLIVCKGNSLHQLNKHLLTGERNKMNRTNSGVHMIQEQQMFKKVMRPIFGEAQSSLSLVNLTRQQISQKENKEKESRQTIKRIKNSICLLMQLKFKYVSTNQDCLVCQRLVISRMYCHK